MSTLFGDIRLRCPALRHVLLPDDAWPLVLTAVAAVRARPPRLRNYLAERCRRCGALHERAIVPPTMKAVFSSHPRLGYLWALAFDALAAARRVIVIGVSFAPSDYLLRWLLRATLNAAQDFIVVDIDREVARAVSAMVGSNVAWYPSLSAYLDDNGAESVSARQARA